MLMILLKVILFVTRKYAHDFAQSDIVCYQEVYIRVDKSIACKQAGLGFRVYI